jgi:hypothetical protein
MSEAEKAVRVTYGNVDDQKLSFGVHRNTVMLQMRSLPLGVKSVRRRVMLSSNLVVVPSLQENEE